MFKLKRCNLEDTIAAISTFPGKSALGVIKISGKKALDIISKIFLPKKEKNIKEVPTYTLHYGWIVEDTLSSCRKDCSISSSNSGLSIVDEVIVSVMRAPYSYTREDVVEVSSHGGIVVLNKILELILEKGARQALPGEFTYRAFLRGRLDLIQAQAVLDIVEANTYQGLSLAMRNLKGETSKIINEIKESVKKIFINLEAYINFPEEEVNFSLEEIKKELVGLTQRVEDLIKGADDGEFFKEGLQCVICGKTNVGKSTLFNYLLKKERAIVTELPGTTRDAIHEEVIIEGVPLRIYDTAGVFSPRDAVEEKAVEKSYQKLAEADLVIFLFDYSRPLDKNDFFLLEKVKDKEVIFVINKIDLKNNLDLKNIPSLKSPLIKISAKKGIGIESLRKEIFTIIQKKGIGRTDNLVLLTQWQKGILKEVKENLQKSLEFINKGYTIDLVTFSIQEVVTSLGKLTGEVKNEEILEGIFENFCIGK